MSTRQTLSSLQQRLNGEWHGGLVPPWAPRHGQPFGQDHGTRKLRSRGTRQMALILITLVGLLAVGGCEQSPAPQECYRGQSDFDNIMSTGARIIIYANTRDEGQAAMNAAEARLRQVEASLNRYSTTSQIAALHWAAGGPPLAVDETTGRAVAEAKRWSVETGGAYNPLVGNLIDLWRNGHAQNRLPTESEIAGAMALLDIDDVAVSKSDGVTTCRLAREKMQLDLGGMAKGWAADEALAVLKTQPGVRAALVMIGGDGASWSEDRWPLPWRFGIQHPLRTEPPEAHRYADLELARGAVVTSGNYRRGFTIAGRGYNHIVDPRTGRPVENSVVSATVIHPSGGAADALATACVVLGPQDGVALLERLRGTEGLILELRDGHLVAHATSGFAAFRVSGKATP
jgi:FAD:protein FMN transferase